LIQKLLLALERAEEKEVVGSSHRDRVFPGMPRRMQNLFGIVYRLRIDVFLFGFGTSKADATFGGAGSLLECALVCLQKDFILCVSIVNMKVIAVRATHDASKVVYMTDECESLGIIDDKPSITTDVTFKLVKQAFIVVELH
jgi:hypothetical protein